MPTPEQAEILTLGDIDPKDAAKKIRRFKPLADYLARHLGEFGIREGRVVIARDIDEMARLLADGQVDFYFNSSFPALTVQALSGTNVILRRWKQGDPTYWSTYIALRDNGISGVDDFVGKVIAFKEPHSTSGFILPAGTLIQRGFTLTEVSRPDAEVAPQEVGYIFAVDEQNTMELLIRGEIAGAGVSNQDYDQLPPELKQQIVAFDQTIAVPRQLVSARPDIGPALADKVQRLLIDLDQTDEGLQILENLKKTAKFDPLPADSHSSLRLLQDLIRLVAEK